MLAAVYVQCAASLQTCAWNCLVGRDGVQTRVVSDTVCCKVSRSRDTLQPVDGIMFGKIIFGTSMTRSVHKKAVCVTRGSRFDDCGVSGL